MNVVLRLALLAALFVLAAPAHALAANPLLTATVGTEDGTLIEVRDAGGALVSHLPAGTYDIAVHDNSTFHNFHLTGPGVSQTTTVAFKGTVTWTVTFAAGASYHYQCDPHATFMKGDIAIDAAPPPPPTTATLSVTRAGSGGGTVTSTPAGIDCGATCSAPFALGSSVTLTATPAAGSAFTGWNGACTGTGACTVALGADAAVSAGFEPASAGPQPPPPPASPGPPPAETPQPPATSESLPAVAAGHAAHAARHAVTLTALTPRVARVAGLRRVLARLRLGQTAVVQARLLRGTRVLVTARTRLRAGQRTLVLRLPRALASGRYTVRLSATAAGALPRTLARTIIVPKQ